MFIATKWNILYTILCWVFLQIESGHESVQKRQLLVFESQIIVIFLSEMNPERQKRHLVALTA